MSGILNAIGLGGNKTEDDNMNQNNSSNMSSSNSSTSTNHHLKDKNLNQTSAASTTRTSGSGYQTGSGYVAGSDMSNSTYGSDSTRMRTDMDRTTDINRGTDNAMTRSEEVLHVGKESVEAGKARLHKYVTTERVEKDVNLEKETVTLEREPITDPSQLNPTIGEAEYEVALREERAVVDKEVVPKERVRLAKQVNMISENVGDDIRKEHIEYGTTPGVQINKTGSSSTSTSTRPISSTTTTSKDGDLNLQGLKVAGATTRDPAIKSSSTTSA